LRDGQMPKVLTLLSISSSSELDRLFEIGIDAVHKERERKEQTTGLNREIKSRLEGLEPQY
ncbi:MAG: hypothetical protein OIN90_08335, partial [Candidatus Methanoperedens sp.]|nr:hypothetical protein [Candidatus Methanoperedens sp.]